MKDEKGNDLKDLDGNQITTKVFVSANPSLKEKLLSKHKPESDLGEKNQDAYQDGVQGALTFMEGQIEKSIWKMIDRSSHPTSGKSFKEHAEDSKIVKCIECMEQICGTKGDESFIYAPSDYHNRVSELNTLEQGEKSKAEYEEKLRR